MENKIMIMTPSGFECMLDKDALDDMELLEKLIEMDKGNTLVLPEVLEMLLGEEKKKLYDFCRSETGRVPASRVAQVVAEIFAETSKYEKK